MLFSVIIFMIFKEIYYLLQRSFSTTLYLKKKMVITENSFHVNGLEINQRTLCVHVCISAHRNTYTYVDYIHVYMCVYIYL